MNLISEAFMWILDPPNWTGPSGIPTRVAQHLVITAVAVLLAVLLALPTGLAIGHTRRGAGFVGAVTGAVRAVPTLGLLTLFGLVFGIGLTAPMLALVALAVPSILGATYAGLHAIDPNVPQAAQALGMNPLQVVRLVEMPLAAPVIIGGIRTATLQVVATATLAAYVADTGLGRYLFAGLKTRDYPQMIGGAILVILLAVALEILLAAWQRQSAARLQAK